MAKKWYEVTLKPLQPLHIGSGNYGVVNPTRIFIPGWTMWGALTAAFGKHMGWNKNDLSKDQNELFEQVSNFYPVIDSKILFPNFKNGEFCLGEYSEKVFRYYATETFASTAINASTQTAKDKMLYEIEYLLPVLKDKKKKIFWQGSLFVDLDQSKLEEFLKEFLRRGEILYIGGERSKGFGMMEIEMITELEKREDWSNPNRKIFTNFVKDSEWIEYGKATYIAEIEKSDSYDLTLKKLTKIYLPGCRKSQKAPEKERQETPAKGRLIKGVLVK